MEHTANALITGGHGALAREMGEALAEAGMSVMSPGRDELDVADSSSVSEYFKSQGQLDLLVCNAGVIDDQMLSKMPEESWDAVINTNLKGAFLAARAAAKIMLKQRGRGGHIVFVSSYAAFHPSLGQSNYASAKAALAGLAKSMAKELGGRNIRVNVIVPGFMETKMTAALSDRVLEGVRAKHALPELNTPEKVGKFLKCLHLEMLCTSGQVFNLDSRII